MENPTPPITPEVPIPVTTPITPEVTPPTPPIPTAEKGAFLSGQKLEIAQLFVLGLIGAAFAVQIYYFRKKAMEESDYMKLENRINSLENKILSQ